MRRRLTALLLASVLVIAGPADAQQPLPSPPSSSQAGDAARGKVLYSEVGCYACHGLAGQGAQATGPRLARTQLPLAAFVMLLRRPLNQMPPYTATVLTDQEAADIYAYVLRLPAPPDPKTLPLLRANR